MTFPTKEEIRSTIEGLEETAKRAKEDPEFAREVLKCLEDRPLTTQPELTPKQRSERLLNGDGKTQDATGG